MTMSTSMMTLTALFLAAVITTALPTHATGHGHHHHHTGPEPVDDWFDNLSHAKPTRTKLHIYIHDILVGKDPTIVPVAQAKGTAKSATEFGLIEVVDDPLTLGLGLDSEKVGHVEGVYVSASKETASVMIAVNFVFTAGKYNGSSLSVLGRIPKMDPNREFPVLGGSGFFRLAQGVVTAEVHPEASGNHVVECKFKIVHY